jgi:hypothetical protein
VIVLPNRLLVVLVSLVGAAALALTAGAATAHSAIAYKKCSLSEREQNPRGAKPTYNLTLRQHRTTCSTAKKVQLAFHKCRRKSAVTCKQKVLRHWKCTGKKDSTITTIFYAHFTCSFGVRRVRGTYQQNT